MTPQDFKALLEALQRISKAIEGKSGNAVVETVNRFSVVFKELKQAYNIDSLPKIKEHILEVEKLYAKIASEILNENN